MNTDRFQEVVVKSNTILIALAKEPTFDMVASALSLYVAFANYGKKVSVFCSSPMLVEFNELVGIDRVGQELGSKHLTITLKDYPADSIERVSYNIENGHMQLTIIPKQGVQAPQANQITPSYGGVSADLVILLGVDDPARLGDGISEELARAPQSVLILHQRRLENPPMPRTFSHYTVEINGGGTSCYSELIGQLISASNLPLDRDSARNLLFGLGQATHNYTTPQVRPETFEIAARLMRVASPPSPPPAAPLPTTPRQQTPADWTGPKVYKSTNEV